MNGYMVKQFDTIEERVAHLKKEIPPSVTLVGVTKGVDLSDIQKAVAVGITHVGENRVQSAKEKKSQLHTLPIVWHMIGHLQSNKVKEAVRIFDLIQSVDSLSLAQRIGDVAIQEKKRQRILLQLNLSGDNKSGFSLEACARALPEVLHLSGIQVDGFMTMAPYTSEEGRIREVFRRLKSFQVDQTTTLKTEFPILSMGMTNDYPLALLEGSTMVRIGRYIFEER